MDVYPVPDPETVTSRVDFIAFVQRLQENLQCHSEEWENTSLERFLEALARYADVFDAYVRNVGSPIDPEQPSWQLFAVLLCGAKVYE